eukprot:Amastigsp_a341942_108.p3 type:complete len:124 gc:universal Amastigsp_a341942_108:518-889(+)
MKKNFTQIPDSVSKCSVVQTECWKPEWRTRLSSTGSVLAIPMIENAARPKFHKASGVLSEYALRFRIQISSPKQSGIYVRAASKSALLFSKCQSTESRCHENGRVPRAHTSRTSSRSGMGKLN